MVISKWGIRIQQAISGPRRDEETRSLSCWRKHNISSYNPNREEQSSTFSFQINYVSIVTDYSYSNRGDETILSNPNIWKSLILSLSHTTQMFHNENRSLYAANQSSARRFPEPVPQNIRRCMWTACFPRSRWLCSLLLHHHHHRRRRRRRRHRRYKKNNAPSEGPENPFPRGPIAAGCPKLGVPDEGDFPTDRYKFSCQRKCNSRIVDFPPEEENESSKRVSVVDSIWDRPSIPTPICCQKRKSDWVFLFISNHWMV